MTQFSSISTSSLQRRPLAFGGGYGGILAVSDQAAPAPSARSVWENWKNDRLDLEDSKISKGSNPFLGINGQKAALTEIASREATSKSNFEQIGAVIASSNETDLVSVYRSLKAWDASAWSKSLSTESLLAKCQERATTLGATDLDTLAKAAEEKEFAAVRERNLYGIPEQNIKGSRFLQVLEFFGLY